MRLRYLVLGAALAVGCGEKEDRKETIAPVEQYFDNANWTFGLFNCDDDPEVDVVAIRPVNREEGTNSWSYVFRNADLLNTCGQFPDTIHHRERTYDLPEGFVSDIEELIGLEERIFDTFASTTSRRTHATTSRYIHLEESRY